MGTLLALLAVLIAMITDTTTNSATSYARGDDSSGRKGKCGE
jgi:hypothetical protein